MKRVFADTFYFLALLNSKVQAHARAVAAALAFQGEIVTTAWVLTEFAEAMCAPENRLECVALVADPRTDPQVRIYLPDTILFDDGLELFARRSDKEWSLTDCISFVVMQREGIAEALTGDRHFEQAGFTMLLK